MEYQSSEGFELLAILLVSHGSGGSHLLFKYPFTNRDQGNGNNVNAALIHQYKNKKSPYSYVSSDNTNWIIEKKKNLVTDGLLGGLSSDVLAALCITSQNQLELKIDNVFFLSSKKVLQTNQAIYNIVFAVRSPLPRPVIRCYQTLSLTIAKALMKEESNASYLSSQAKILNDSICEHQNLSEKLDDGFSEAFEISSLAKEFKQIYESIKQRGVLDLSINSCTKLSFCLPHLAYKIADKIEQTQVVDIILTASKYLKPYFAFLLLVPRETLLELLPSNCNFYTHRLIKLYNPSYSFTRYAAELDVPVEEVYGIVDHLIHWAKIKIIYPITETNVYVINPSIHIYIGSSLHEAFKEEFKNYSFHATLSQFSEAKLLVEYLDPRHSKEKHADMINILIWFLQNNALIQVHTFVYLLPRKTEHHRLACEFSKISGLSIDEESELMDSRALSTADTMPVIGAGSEHSNDTENTDQKDLSAVYDEYRELFNEHRISEKDQQYIFKAFEAKSEQDIKLFIQLMPYFNGTYNIEAIIYHERLNRSDIMTFLDKFKDLLICTEYEDPNPLIRVSSTIN